MNHESHCIYTRFVIWCVTLMCCSFWQNCDK